MKIQKYSDETKNVLEVARNNHWGFRIMGDNGMLNEPRYKFGWWFIPIQQDNSIIPTRAQKRVAELERKGIRIQGMIVAHETPMLLPAPKVEPKPEPKKVVKKPIKIDYSRLGVAMLEIVGLVFKMAFGLLAGVVTGILALFGLVLTAGASLILIDPALIVVLEDGTWVEVMSWYE